METPPPMPTPRPSILSRIGLAGLTVVPALLALSMVGTGISESSGGLFVGGAVLLVVIVAMIVMAQTTPGWRRAAMITMGVLSGLILGTIAVGVLALAVLFAMCASALGGA
ncbi:hypothetical protein HAHE_07000 [Haloferula helveola]|uniref:Major facilitator superfamily (MFS) profile domain-containing protein n=1 Tax=Haloferula helveola TaxID=490095 RepID=A0ABM7RBS2_9BACT|nr:hypothetical protein HAHE_07000 [Haloferula helveola]